MFTLKEVTIVAFEILGSVGISGDNHADDIITVKTLLNGISPENGGAFGSLDEKDGTAAGADFERMTEAIKIFQLTKLKAFFIPDGLVSPSRRTIRALREEFLKRNARPKDEVGIFSVKSTEVLGGFSKERLKPFGSGKNRKYIIDRNGPLSQMVPLGGSKSLLVSAGNLGLLRFTIDDQNIARILSQSVTSAGTILTVTGVSDGKTFLSFFVNGNLTERCALIVRPSGSVTVNFHFVRDARGRGSQVQAGAGAALVQGLNSIYQSQTNLKFKLGLERNIDTINGRSVDFEAQFILDDEEKGIIPRGSEQIFKESEFFGESTALQLHINMFLIHRLRVARNQKFRGIAASSRRLCWVDTEFSFGGDIRNRLVLLAHEIGHTLGLVHIGLPEALMFQNPDVNNVLIPSETLEDLTV